MARTFGIRAIACLALVLAYSHAQAQIVCQGGGKKELRRPARFGSKRTAITPSMRLPKRSGQVKRRRAMDGRVCRRRKERACRDSMWGRRALSCDGSAPDATERGKDYKIETKQGNNRADTTTLGLSCDSARSKSWRCIGFRAYRF